MLTLLKLKVQILESHWFQLIVSSFSGPNTVQYFLIPHSSRKCCFNFCHSISPPEVPLARTAYSSGVNLSIIQLQSCHTAILDHSAFMGLFPWSVFPMGMSLYTPLNPPLFVILNFTCGSDREKDNEPRQGLRFRR